MFGKLKNLFNAQKPVLEVLAPVAGEAVKIQEVPDPTFSEEMLGKGIGIKPTGTRVVAPAAGTIDLMFDTGHAVSMTSDDGIELLVHVGLDTIKLKGKHYTCPLDTTDAADELPCVHPGLRRSLNIHLR